MSKCYVCQESETFIKYEDLEDRLFNSRFLVSLETCRNQNCGHTQAVSSFSDNEISEMYDRYYTHSSRDSWYSLVKTKIYESLVKFFLYSRSVGNVNKFTAKASKFFLSCLMIPVPWLKSYFLSGTFFLHDVSNKAILEIGCGDGKNLLRFRDCGFQTFAVDFDPAAVEASKNNGVDARIGGVEEIKNFNRKFDIIVLRHVIEHLPDPINSLHLIKSVMTDGGMIVIITPNSNSFGHSYFGSNWRGLEPPRHLNIFTKQSLAIALSRSGLKYRAMFTYPSLGPSIFYSSMKLKNPLSNHALTLLFSFVLSYVAVFSHLFDNDNGEELIAFAICE